MFFPRSIILFSCCVVVSLGMPYYLVEDADGVEYSLISLERQRRSSPLGTDEDMRKVLAQVEAMSHGNRPNTYQGTLQYQGSSGNGAYLSGSHTQGHGGEVGVGGNVNLWSSQDGNTRIDATGGISKPVGPGGGKPDVHGGVGLSTSW